ncbi:GNAT family N-acetyltransferase [Sphingomonas sp.]|uniref:GNAT family N-acetyltransferase n=1 Tax=Sphingomonas sp. TaxID=28214 RepID=UPI001B193A0E|nr:GNAT family N-acetyltransferase [Sphingomonas sp.]MBO9715084.1 GNAT family N-acetyltransferase [Sphingomonas sp.]
MTGILYRDATPADGPELDAMARQIWIETFAHGSSAEDAATYLAKAYGPEGQLLRDLGAAGIDFRLAVAGGRIVGYAKLNPVWLPDPEPGALQLSQIYVASDWHGKGIAQQLMAWTADRARERGASALLLTVWEHNPRAIAFYRRLGFVHVGDYDFAVGEQVDRDLILRLQL